MGAVEYLTAAPAVESDEPSVFDIQFDGVWLEVSAHVETPRQWRGFDPGSPGSADIVRVTAGGCVDISDLLSDKQLDRLEDMVIEAARKKREHLGPETAPARKLMRGAQMLAESVLSPEAAAHPHSIALQAQAVLQLVREVQA